MNAIRFPYGYRAKLGLIVVGPNPTPREDIGRMSPDGVLVLETRVSLEPRIELDNIHQLSEKLPEAAAVLAQSKCDVIAAACTAGTITAGPGHDKREIADMQNMAGGIPCTTVASAVDNALSWFSVQKLAIASPYLDNINEDFRKYYVEKGVNVTGIETLGINNSHDLSSVTPDRIYKLGRSVVTDEAQAIFVPCTTFPAIDAIEELERDTRKVVISSNQALLWEMLRIAGIDEPIHGFGELLSRPGRCEFA